MGLILGLDVSIASTGLAIYAPETDRVTYAAKISTTTAHGTNLERVHRIVTAIKDDMGQGVSAVAYEDGYMSKNMMTGMTLSWVRGAIAYALYKYKPCPMLPSEVKRILIGNGAGKKYDVAEYVAKNYAKDLKMLGIGGYNDGSGKDKTSDMYDAMAVAIAYHRKVSALR